MVLTLANDSSDVAAIVLACSPLLSDAELVECATTGDAVAQSAIALRPWVSAQVAAALAKVGARKALITLALNPGAEVLEFSIRRMIERYGHDPDLRAALLARPNLSAVLRSDLAGAAVKALSAMMTGCAGLTPERARCLTREARERANVKIAAETAGEANEILNFVAHLRRSSQLTAGLLLRGLLCGNKHLLETALCELSGLAMPRVMRLVAEAKSAGFAALYRKAHMPEHLRRVFIAGLEAVAKSGCGGPMNARLQKPIVDSVLHACASVKHGELDRLIVALRRLEAEAARDEAREFRRARAPSHALPDFASTSRLPPAARTKLRRPKPCRNGAERPQKPRASQSIWRLSRRSLRQPEPCQDSTGWLFGRQLDFHRRA
jgi:uncharacterized protein (DUF2336 family)